MSKVLFTSGEIARAIGAAKSESRFYEGRVRTLIVSGLLVPSDKTEGGHLRFGRDQLALAAIYSAMLDMSLSHSAPAKPQGYDQSPFTAVQWALTVHHMGQSGKIDRTKDTPESVLARAAANPNAITRAMMGVAKGQWWVLRIDLMIDDQTGHKRYLASASEMGKPLKKHPEQRDSETPMGAIILQLNPLLLPIITDRSGAN